MSKIFVDDEVWTCDPLRRFLEAKGHDVIVSYDGKVYERSYS